MKKIMLYIFILFSFIFIWGCGENKVVEIKFKEEIPEFVIDNFDLYDYTLVIKREEGKDKEIKVDKSMISDDDLSKLSKPGSHNITITYEGYEYNLVINILSSEAQYIVEYYLEDLNGNYSMYESENHSGLSFTSPEIRKEYDGFTLDEYTVIELDPREVNVIKAYYKRNVYNLSILVDGNIYQNYEYKYQEKVSVQEPVKENAEFVAFDNEIPETMPAHDVKINSIFNDIYYTCKFVDYDGTVLSEMKVKQGSVMTYHIIPERSGNSQYSYVFKEWTNYQDKMIINKDYIFEAVYEEIINKYNVKFVNYDNSLILEETYDYGQMPSFNSNTPIKEKTELYSYVFKGWDKQFDIVTKDVTYKAVYEEVRNYFEVTVIGYGSIKTYKVNNGEGLIIEDPVKTGHTFVGWSKDISCVQEDMIIEPIYEINKYNLNYYLNGELYKTVEYKYNEKITLIDPPTLDGKKFKEWQNTIEYMPASNYDINGKYFIISEFLNVVDPSKTYDGLSVENPDVETNSDGRIAYEYFQNGKRLSRMPENVGTYVLKVYIETTDDYYGIEADFPFEIYKRKADIYINDKTSVYGEELDTLTFDTDGFVNRISANLYKEEGTTVGSYAITTDYVDSNYDITYHDGVYTIEKAYLKYQINDKESIYKEEIKELDYNLIEGKIYNSDNIGLELFREEGLDAGSYKITGRINNDNYIAEFIDGTYTIHRAEAIITAEDYSSIYNGNEHVIDYSLNHEETEIIFDCNTFIDAGEYVVTFIAEETKNYNRCELSVKVEIDKAETIIEAENYESDYNKEKHYVSAYINHDEEVINYSENGLVNAGVYEILISVNESKNYKPASKIVVLVINKIASEITADNFETVYDGNKYFIEATLNHDEVDLIYYNNGKINAGIYEVEIVAEESTNYLPSKAKVNLIINKAETIITGEDLTVDYDGETHSIFARINHNESVIEYSCNGFVNANTYEIVASVEESENYNAAEMTYILVINRIDPIIKVGNTHFVYNKEYQTVYAELNHEECELEIINNVHKNAGTYEVVITAKETTNYNELVVKAEMTIDKASSSIDVIRKDYVYDGTAHSVIASLSHDETTIIHSNFDIINAGSYEVVLEAEETENYFGVKETCTLYIDRAISSITGEDVYAVYDGNSYSVKAYLNHDEVNLEYSLNSFVDAGEYNVTVKAEESLNYYSTTKDFKVIIDKAKSVISAENMTTQYDGNAHYVSGKLNHNDAEIEYSDNGFVNAGVYTVEISVIETKNYTSASVIVTITIYSGDYDYAGLSFSNSTVVYDGKSHSIYINGTLPQGMNVVYENNGMVNAGTYQVKAILTDTTGNYKEITPLTATLTILQAETKLSAESIKDVYDVNKVHYITGYADNKESQVLYKNNTGHTDSGVYEIEVYSLETTNYKAASIIVTITIEKAETIITGENASGVYNGKPYYVNASMNHSETELIIEGNGKINAGNYKVIVTANASRNYLAASAEFSITIDKAQTVITTKDMNVDYTGNSYSLSASYNHSEGKLISDKNEFVNAGTYRVKFTVEDTENYYGTSATATLVINKIATIITGENVSGKYNGEPYNVKPSMNHSETEMIIKGNGKVDAGNYIVVVTTSESTNYLAGYAEFQINIDKIDAIITLNSSVDFIYNGATQGISCKLNHNETNLEYSNNDNIVGGKYDVVVSAKETTNYNAATFSVSYTIKYHVRFFNYDNTLLYEVKVLPTEEIVYPYEYPTRPTTILYKYVFEGWDTDYSMVNDNYKIYPIFEEIPLSYKVVYRDFVGNDYKVFTNVTKNEYVVPENYPVVGSSDINNCYKFIEWEELNYDKAIYVDNELCIYVNPKFELTSGICRINDLYFAMIEDAFSVANSGDVVEVVYNENGIYEINHDFTIPYGTTLYIPYASNIALENANGDVVGGTPSEDKLYLTVSLNSTINIYGTLIIGAETGNIGQNVQGAINGRYSELLMNSGSRINVGSFDGVNTGKLDCYGFITDVSGSTGTDKPIINVYTSSVVRELFTLTDWISGSYALAYYTDVAVFNRFQMASIDVESHYYNGSRLNGFGKIYAGGQMNKTDFRVFGLEETNGIHYGLLYLSSTNASDMIVKDFHRKVKFSSSTDYTDKCDITVYGDCADYYASLTVNYAGREATVTTKSVQFPVHYGMNLTIASGTFTCKYSYKILPGATVTINKGATLNFKRPDTRTTSDVAVFDHYNYPDSMCNYPTPEELAANGHNTTGSLIVNGSLISTERMYLGGTIVGTGSIRVTSSTNLYCDKIVCLWINDGEDYTENIKLYLYYNGTKITSSGTYY